MIRIKVHKNRNPKLLNNDGKQAYATLGFH